MIKQLLPTQAVKVPDIAILYDADPNTQLPDIQGYRGSYNVRKGAIQNADGTYRLINFGGQNLEVVGYPPESRANSEFDIPDSYCKIHSSFFSASRFSCRIF